MAKSKFLYSLYKFTGDDNPPCPDPSILPPGDSWSSPFRSFTVWGNVHDSWASNVLDEVPYAQVRAWLDARGPYVRKRIYDMPRDFSVKLVHKGVVEWYLIWGRG